MPRRRIAVLGLQSLAMDTATAGSGLKWVGRAIRRLEDPALVRGRGRFTADLPAAHFVRFVRSPVAAGRVVRISAPEGVAVIRASDLGAQPIKPMLHKYNYRPIEQPILADEVVRFVGEPIAAVVAPTPAQAEDAADRVEIDRRCSGGCGRAAGCRGCSRHRQSYSRRPIQDRRLRRCANQSTPAGSSRRAVASAKRDAT